MRFPVLRRKHHVHPDYVVIDRLEHELGFEPSVPVEKLPVSRRHADAILKEMWTAEEITTLRERSGDLAPGAYVIVQRAGRRYHVYADRMVLVD